MLSIMKLGFLKFTGSAHSRSRGELSIPFWCLPAYLTEMLTVLDTSSQPDLQLDRVDVDDM